MVTMLADYYSDDWETLWWVRADGRAAILADQRQMAAPLRLLADRYWQYRQAPPTGPVLAVTVERWSGWTGARDMDRGPGDLGPSRHGRATRRGLRRHWMFAVLVAGAAALRAVVFAAYHPALIFPDSVRYLQYADNFAAGHWSADGLRQSGYSVLIVPVMLLHGVWLIPLAQHLVGLATAVLVYAVLIRFGTRTWLAAVATIPVLFDPLQLILEQYVLTDTWTVFLIAAATSRPGLAPGNTGGSLGLASGGGLRAAARAGRDGPGRNADHDRAGCPVRAGCGPAAAAPPDAARRAHRLLPPPGGRLPRLVRGLARRAELHHLQRRVPLRPRRGLRLLPRADPARLREAAARPHSPQSSGTRTFTPGTRSHRSGRSVPRRAGPGTQWCATSACGSCAISRSPISRPQAVTSATGFPRSGRRAGALLAGGLPAVRHLHPARPAGLRLDCGSRLPGPRGATRAGGLPDRLRRWFYVPGPVFAAGLVLGLAGLVIGPMRRLVPAPPCCSPPVRCLCSSPRPRSPPSTGATNSRS